MATPSPRRLTWPALASAVLVAAGCGPDHHVLNPASPDAAAIEGLWWILFWVSVVVLVVVLAIWGYALFRRRPEGGQPEAEGRSMTWVLAGAFITAGVLIGLTLVTVLTGARISAAAEQADGLEVELIGHQFWWEVRYPDAGVITANEIHIPAGEPTRFRLVANDVIHSLWVPRLHGKLDLTPGRVTQLVLHPDEPGVYRGFCAEFCGAQHARMGLLIVAQPRAEFDTWLARQASPAPPPADPEQMRGLDLFTRLDCHQCHTVRGGGLDHRSQGTGPDLTHLSSRRTLGAVTMDNNRVNLARWIEDPHQIKPGVLMPATIMDPDDLNALVGYLVGLGGGP